MCDLTIINAGVILQEANSGEHMAGGFCRVMADIDPQIMMKILMPGEIPVKSKRYPAILPKNHPVFMGQLPIFLAEKSQLCSNPTISLGKKKPMCQWFLFLLSRLQILAGCTPLWCWNPRHVYQWNPRCKSSFFGWTKHPKTTKIEQHLNWPLS